LEGVEKVFGDRPRLNPLHHPIVRDERFAQDTNNKSLSSIGVQGGPLVTKLSEAKFLAEEIRLYFRII